MHNSKNLRVHSILRVATASILALVVSITPLPLDVTNGTVNAATQPGYMGKILYETSVVLDSEVYVMDSDGGNQIQLTNDSGNSFNPTWSPDGTKIAFVSNRDGAYKLYTMNSDGSNQTKLSDLITGQQDIPQWSPDGEKILLKSANTLYAIGADGSNLTSLGTIAHGNTQWSPDGQKITFRRSISGNSEIYTIDADGANLTKLTDNPASDYHPKWSPDGQKINFISNRSGVDQLYTINADGTNLLQISDQVGFRWLANNKWSPDGTKIAASTEEDAYPSVGKLIIANSDGNSHTVCDLNGDGIMLLENLDWSADGQQLLITGVTDNIYFKRDIFAINPDCTNLVRLTNNAPLDENTGGAGRHGLDWFSIPNQAPTAANDMATTAYITPALIDALVNDTDEQALNGQYLSIHTPPNHGTASVADGKVRYTPRLGFTGSDSLVYQICDSFLLDQKCATGIVDITVLEPASLVVSVAKINGEQFNATTSKYATNLRPTFSGTATPGSEIKVEIHSDPIVLTTMADGDGNWSVTPSFDLPTGEHVVYVSATLAGFTTTLDEFGLTIGTLASTGINLWVVIAGGFSTMAGGIGLLAYRSKAGTAGMSK